MYTSIPWATGKGWPVLTPFLHSSKQELKDLQSEWNCDNTELREKDYTKTRNIIFGLRISTGLKE